ncbi:YpjP family protein [Sediminibacillus halophilus]|uniref:YpjP-like protein n=1 Tax=Sediminibacillus halophilus TaxID=482461 RepID=A0A1G9NZ76_9BACI|nr:YpjP family protein [Sediminibacillus halophilus]SDL91858.1 YpjP-like protein [Sediminibacillus halophilus]
MKLWLKKISVILITFMTLGMYIPPNYLDTSAAEKDEVLSKSDSDTHASVAVDVVDREGETETLPDETADSSQLIASFTEQAAERTVAKLGPRIYPKVEDEFTANILPALEQVVNDILLDAGEEKIPYFVITEQPGSGYGERIFNIHDQKTGKDVAKFHVRRDNRPGEGYWFNFHYHVNRDGFEGHYTIGEIYWDKNTPPKWMV